MVLEGRLGSQQGSNFLEGPCFRVLAEHVLGIHCLAKKNLLVMPTMGTGEFKLSLSNKITENNKPHTFMSSNTRGHFYKSFLFLIFFFFFLAQMWIMKGNAIHCQKEYLQNLQPYLAKSLWFRLYWNNFWAFKYLIFTNH